jgi:hypothetical protein
MYLYKDIHEVYLKRKYYTEGRTPLSPLLFGNGAGIHRLYPSALSPSIKKGEGSLGDRGIESINPRLLRARLHLKTHLWALDRYQLRRGAPSIKTS